MKATAVLCLKHQVVRTYREMKTNLKVFKRGTRTVSVTLLLLYTQVHHFRLFDIPIWAAF
jgi:hypothetical protein